jgi:hypothetical protein
MICGCKYKGSKYKDIFGKEYVNLTDLDSFKDYKYVGGALTKRIDTTNYGIDIYKKDSLYVVAFEYMIQQIHKANTYILIDIVEINGIKKNQEIGYVTCLKDGKEDRSIFVVYESSNSEHFKNISRAWVANFKTKKIEEIDSKSVDCINENFNMQGVE